MKLRWMMLVLGFFFIFNFLPIRGYSFPITITATGDNYLYWYNWGSNGWEKLDDQDYDSWKASSTLTLDWGDNWGYLVFAVKNRGNGSPGNPAGLLAEVNVNGEDVYSDESWDVFSIPEAWSGVPAFDVQVYLSMAGWHNATWYAYNSGAVNALYPMVDSNHNGLSCWYDNNGGAISNIDGVAKWIWSENDFSFSMDKGILVGLDISSIYNTNAPADIVPEPNSFILLFMGIFALFFGKMLLGYFPDR